MALIRPQTQILSAPQLYDGHQLSSHWIYRETGIQGDAILAFSGPVMVRGDDLVDLADQREELFIAGENMLHFIAESFGPCLDKAVMMQRLLVFLSRELLVESGTTNTRRQGDDLFWQDGKLSVSIATVSGVSSLVHFGINIDNEGTPVKTASLKDCSWDGMAFAERLVALYADELEQMGSATTKVRSVP